MRTIKAVLAGLIAASVSMAAISGKVTDTSGTVAISGALVQLEKGGQSVTTGPEGLFSLSGSTAIIPEKGLLSEPQNPLATIRNGLLWVNVAEKSAVEVSTFDLSGKAFSIMRRTMEAGMNSIAAPYRGKGVYLTKVKSGNREIVLKGNYVDGVLFGSAVYSQGLSSNHMAKQAKATATINDVIAVTKEGFLNYRVEVKNPDTGGIQIKMIVCADTVRDVDGNLYQAVRIGSQVWTVENLRVTKYNDGSLISLDTSTITWNMATTPKYCFYENTTNADSIKKYGALYNWYVVKTGKLTPSGWHVPTDAEWTIMEKYLVLNGYNWDETTDTAQYNKIAKSLAAKTDWFTFSTPGAIGRDLTKNNCSGFSALPGGCRNYNGTFYDLSSFVRWWTTTEKDASNALNRYLHYDNDYLGRFNSVKSGGFSVRLVRDSVHLE
jgi:uncharacterized protein (TIGR02145 family)